MAVRHRRDLGQMRHTQNLLALCDACQLRRDPPGRPIAGDSGVYLVKNQGRDSIPLCHNILDGQHDPRQLAAGGDAGSWALMPRPR